MTTESTATLVQISAQASRCSNDARGTWRSSESPLAGNLREKRFATCEPVDIRLLDMNNLRLNGTLRVVTNSGMQIELNMPVQIGDRLEVVLQKRVILFAEVQYCLKSGDSYQIGSRIDDIYYPKDAGPPRASKTAKGELPSKQLALQIRLVEKRPAITTSDLHGAALESVLVLP